MFVLIIEIIVARLHQGCNLIANIKKSQIKHLIKIKFNHIEICGKAAREHTKFYFYQFFNWNLAQPVRMIDSEIHQ